ncbi:tetraacyldisaccharide 4'-kinase [Oryzomonas rubra]|uniref:Tetraacyldisaccharide 4'-kinase n=1 Tax=Oryzomonas rubra TaxID=2509454 RepID=A0A5A9XIV9_9BACT|nr:tetraacyldisaccharide 4'-kinase [Oryzomonas rubra]KAA0892029.1 tetraacyldisaccharide 4'-kinase [Oryzomonas rubra]
MDLTSSSTYWRSVATGTRKGLAGRLLVLALSPVALLYACIQIIRSTLYGKQILTVKRLPRPVISVGNITVGGTGKTPATAFIARLLIARGLKVAVLSRGYGGSMEGQTAIVADGDATRLDAGQCGDEPYLLAATVPGLMVVMGADRQRAGLLAMEQLSPDIFLLDDGFQHLRLQRDLNILLVDCAHPFGNGWTLPAGLLREPISAVQRADLIIHTRCPLGFSPAPLAGKPACSARHRLGAALPLSGGPLVSFDALRGTKVLAFAGIGEPDPFFEELRTLGLDVVRTIPFPDHAAYTPAQLAGLGEAFRGCGAEYAVTTEKDGVKLRRLAPEFAQKVLLARLEFALDDPTTLMGLLNNLLQK